MNVYRDSMHDVVRRPPLLLRSPRFSRFSNIRPGVSCRWAQFTVLAFGFKLNLISHRVDFTKPGLIFIEPNTKLRKSIAAVNHVAQDVYRVVSITWHKMYSELCQSRGTRCIQSCVNHVAQDVFRVVSITWHKMYSELCQSGGTRCIQSCVNHVAQDVIRVV